MAVDIEHKNRLFELELADKISENKFKEECRQKELQILEDKISENKFKKEYRQKELQLLEIKIKNESKC